MHRTGWIALAAPLALTGCPTAEIYTHSFEIGMSASPTEAAPGDTVRIVATLSNLGRDTLRLEARPGCGLTLFLADPNGRQAAPFDRWSCISTTEAPPAPIVLGPLGSEPQRRSWTWVVGDGVAGPIPEGAYRARATLGEHQEVRGGDRRFKIGHNADSAAVIRVRPRAPRPNQP